MKLKVIIPVVLMGVGFVVWANWDKEDNSKYAVQEIEVKAAKQPELDKVVKATFDLHKRKKTSTLERIFMDTPEKRAAICKMGESDPFKESLEVLDKHAASLNLNDMQYLQLAQKQNCYRVIAKTADETQVCFSFRKSKSGYKIVSIAEL